jgi:hypothetical protein
MEGLYRASLIHSPAAAKACKDLDWTEGTSQAMKHAVASSKRETRRVAAMPRLKTVAGKLSCCTYVVATILTSVGSKRLQASCRLATDVSIMPCSIK